MNADERLGALVRGLDEATEQVTTLTGIIVQLKSGRLSLDEVTVVDVPGGVQVSVTRAAEPEEESDG